MLEITNVNDAHACRQRRFILPNGEEFVICDEHYGGVEDPIWSIINNLGYDYNPGDPCLPINQKMVVRLDQDIYDIRQLNNSVRLMRSI